MSIPLRVLIVNDVENDALLLIQELRRGGFAPTFKRVETRDALRVALQHQKWDIILSDYSLPTLTGLEALEELKAIGWDIPFFIISGALGEETAVAAMRAGARDYLMKNDLGRLVSAVQRELLEAGERHQRRLAEKNLSETSQRLHLAIKAAGLGLWDRSLQTHEVYYSPEWKRQVGHEDHEISSSFAEWEQRLHPEDHDHLIAALDDFIRNPQADFQQEFRLRHKDGSWRWILSRGEMLLGPDGKPIRMLGGNLDITDRKRAEKTLRESEECFRYTFDQSPIGAAIVSLYYHFIRVNQVLCQITGYPPEELLLLSFPDITHPDDLASDVKRSQQLLAGEIDHYHIEKRYLRKQGGIAWVQLSTRLVKDEHGKPLYFLSMVVDITEHKRTEEEQKRLGAAIEQVAEVVFITDNKGTILYVNPAFEKITGYERAEVIGRNSRLLKSGLHDTTFYRNLWEILSRGETWIGHFTNKKKDGTLYEEETTISPVLDPAGRIVNYVAVGRDVTRELEAQQQLLQSQKMDVVGRLAGGVAHDFNNLLMVIGGYASLLLKRLPPKDSSHRMVQEIRQTTERAAGITRQLLAFSHKQVVQTRRLNLNESLAEVGKILKQLLGEDIKVVKKCAPDLLPVMGDPTQIQQVLMNLLINARDAMSKSGTITLETSNLELSSARSKDFPSAPEGKYAMLVVRDTGAGMTPEVQSHLFEPFFSTKERGKGTGLGLSIVYGIVQQSGGHITVQSRVGAGTTFRILLPAVRKNSTDGKPLSPRKKKLSGTETVLLVEDDNKVLEVLARLLEANGYRVIQACNGEEALRVCRSTRKKIHLMLSDVVMPGIKGPDLAQKIQTLRPTLKVVLMSGYSDERTMAQIIAQNNPVFLQKPIPHEKLLQKLREVLDEN